MLGYWRKRHTEAAGRRCYCFLKASHNHLRHRQSNKTTYAISSLDTNRTLIKAKSANFSDVCLDFARTLSVCGLLFCFCLQSSTNSGQKLYTYVGTCVCLLCMCFVFLSHAPQVVFKCASEDAWSHLFLTWDNQMLAELVAFSMVVVASNSRFAWIETTLQILRAKRIANALDSNCRRVLCIWNVRAHGPTRVCICWMYNVCMISVLVLIRIWILTTRIWRNLKLVAK